MTNYLLAFTGNASTPASEEEGRAVMASWGRWFEALGSAVADPGNPTDASKTVATDGSISDGASGGVSGYSIVSADSIDAAAALATSCPHLAAGGQIEVYEIVQVM